ncbi:hypothetical protein A8B75_14975 [Sphingomonadales bacterium EhC05]|nr:hypothetical protein A8B75_14975 [Sphingomonadales bacterium EhC05]
MISLLESEVTMKLQYSQIIAMLSGRHRIASESMIAFKARLKHFQKLGFPEGTNTGKGKKAEYGWDELIQLATALEMLEIGMTPEKAVTALLPAKDELLAEVAKFTQVFENHRPEHICFLCIDLLALAPLRIDKSVGPVVNVFDAHSLSDLVQDSPLSYPFGSVSIINMSQLLMELAELASIHTDLELAAILIDLKLWGVRKAQ